MVLLSCVVYGCSNTKKKTEETRNRETGIPVFTSQPTIQFFFLRGIVPHP